MSDLKKELKTLYAPKVGKVSVVDVPSLQFLMIDGQGDPNDSEEFSAAVTALYSLAYTIRFQYKALGQVFTVMPLEGLWSFVGDAPDTPFDMTRSDKARFVWTLMIALPDFVSAEQVETGRLSARKKKPELPLDRVRFGTYHEGEAVQILHLGSYDEEAPNVARLHDEIAAQGWHLSGRHHEIYLSSMDTPAPKRKTIIRQPFARST